MSLINSISECNVFFNLMYNLNFKIMKKLIKIQGIINQIEHLEEMNPKFKSKFHYTNEWTLEIETYCTEKALAYYMTFHDGTDYIVRIENYKLKIIEHMEP